MKRIIRLTERDLTRIVKRVLKEDNGGNVSVTPEKTGGLSNDEMSEFKKNSPNLIIKTNNRLCIWGEDIPREGRSWRLKFFVNQNQTQIGLGFSTSEKTEYFQVKRIFEGAVSNKIKDNCKIPNNPDGSPSVRTFCVATLRDITEYGYASPTGTSEGNNKNMAILDLFDDMIKDVINICKL